MANSYLDDPVIRDRLKAHDPHLIKAHTPDRFPDDPIPDEVWDFNQKKEVELLDAHFSGYSDTDFRSGSVTVDDTVKAAYGASFVGEEYPTARIIKTWLKSDSTYNRGREDGMVIIVDSDGQTIVRDDARVVARNGYQTDTDTFETNVLKKVNTGSKKLAVSERKAIRTGGSAIKDELDAIKAAAIDNITGQAQKALGA
jgi:hypothetical protein